jgi:hypothetical protein
MSDDYEKRKRELLATKPEKEAFETASDWVKALEHWRENDGRRLQELEDEAYSRSQRIMHEEYLELIDRLAKRNRDDPRQTSIPAQEFDGWVM